MKVAFVGAHLSKGGGQAIQVAQLFRALRKRTDASLLCLDAGGAQRGFHADPDVQVVGRLEFPGGILQLRRAVEARAGEVDLVQAFDAYYGLPAAYLSRFFPRVVRFGTDPTREMRGRYGPAGGFVVGSAMPVLLKETQLVVNSESLRRRFERYRPVLIPNGVDADRFASLPTQDDARRALGLPRDGILLAFVGKVIPVKRIEWILESLRGLPEAHAVLVGGYHEEWYGDAYHRWLCARYADVKERFTFVGEVPWERIGLYLRSADVFVFPSSFEGMPNAVLEAMAAGLPVVASDIPAHRGLVEDGAEMRLAANLAAFQAAVRQFVQEDRTRREMGQAARRYVQKNLTFDRCAERYLQLYESILRGDGPNRPRDSSGTHR